MRRRVHFAGTIHRGVDRASSPAVVDGRVYVAARDGFLYCVDAATGAELWRGDHQGLLGEHVARGVERPGVRGQLDDSLAGLMRGAIARGTAAEVVVVFAIDHLPQQLPDAAQGAPLLRRFLDAGGKLVWPGTPPMLWLRDPATGSPGSYAAIDRSRARRLLDVDFTGANFDRWGSTVTAAGERWGLSGWWTAPWGVAPDRVTEVLAVDENGLAPAWARSFGGRPGSGFVMIGRGPDPWTDAEVVRAVAEHYRC